MFLSPASSRTMLESRQISDVECALRLFAYTDLNSVCYNSVTEHGQMFCVAVPAGGFGAVWLTVHLLSV